MIGRKEREKREMDKLAKAERKRKRAAWAKKNSQRVVVDRRGRRYVVQPSGSLIREEFASTGRRIRMSKKQRLRERHARLSAKTERRDS